MSKSDLIEPELEEEDTEDVEPEPSPIDEVLRNTHERGLSSSVPGKADTVETSLDEELKAFSDPRSRDRGPLLGEVLEERSLDFPGRVLVRWLDDRDQIHERWLVCLRGLRLAAGDNVLLSKPDNWSGWVVTGAIQRGAPQEDVRELDVEELTEALDLKVDGKRVELEGQDEIVLRCGKASITLRRNGRVVIRGTYVESYSRGTNRIKGGTVQIN